VFQACSAAIHVSCSCSADSVWCLGAGLVTVCGVWVLVVSQCVMSGCTAGGASQCSRHAVRLFTRAVPAVLTVCGVWVLVVSLYVVCGCWPCHCVWCVGAGLVTVCGVWVLVLSQCVVCGCWWCHSVWCVGALQVVLSSVPDMQCGYSRELFLQW